MSVHLEYYRLNMLFKYIRNIYHSVSTVDPTSTKFDIAGATGAITLATGQTLAAGSSYTLTVKATDSGTPAMSATATVSVCVGDNCCCSSGFVIHGTVAVIVLGLLSLIL